MDEGNIKKKLGALKTNKSPGPDLQHPVHLKGATEALAKPIATIFQKTLDNGTIPEPWKEAHVTPIFKKGPKAKPGNYRPVSVTSITCRTME